MIRLLLGSALLLFSVELAEAGCGWYLLVPPRSDYDKTAPFLQGIKILTDRPLPKWYHEGGYDSAEACEVMKASHIRREVSVYTKASDEYLRLVRVKPTTEPDVMMQRFITEQDNANTNAFAAARCIASDDPRLR